ncbi:MAG: hypothetical protein AAGF97_08240 [Planctomycetota bacterium]
MGYLLDYVSLAPSRTSLPLGDAEPEWIDVGSQRCQAIRLPGPATHPERSLTLLKFVGASGRAENSTNHPLEHWPEFAGDVWSINPPGYGNSPGRASLKTIVPTALALYDRVAARSKGKIMVMGTSMGAATAMAVASQRPVAGMLLRDIPQIRRVIAQRFGWWTLGLATLSARRVPESLNAIAAATRCQTPALFITSGRDRIVPINIQRDVISAYGGPHQVVHFPQADHGEMPQEGDLPPYFEALDWLRNQISEARRDRVAAPADVG